MAEKIKPEDFLNPKKAPRTLSKSLSIILGAVMVGIGFTIGGMLASTKNLGSKVKSATSGFNPFGGKLNSK